MDASRKCISPDFLREHLQGQLAANDESNVVAHLDTCGTCQETLEHLAAGGEQLLLTAREAGRHPEPSAPALARVLQSSCSGMPSWGTSAEARETGSADLLDSLEPPHDPGHLGRVAHYEVIEPIARGGMGIVLKAIDERLHRVVCLKLLAPHIAASDRARQRFFREARAAAAVKSDHVVAVYAVEEDRERPFLVLEYVPGTTLQHELDRRGPLPIAEVLRIGREIAAGLAAAHAQGLVHRDIKPGNILLDEVSGRVKIADFGLARAVDDPSLTHEGIIAGTPEYMSPEQARGSAVDHCSDLFCLGSVLYAMCAGNPPFTAEKSLTVLKRICDDEASPLESVRPDMPDGLADLVRRLHAKDPADRPQSAAEVQSLLVGVGASISGVRRFSRLVSPRQALVALVLALLAAAAVSVGRWQVGIPQDEQHKASLERSFAAVRNDVERQTAQRVQRLGGELMLAIGDETRKLTSDLPLPAEPFHVLRAGLSDQGHLGRADFERLGQLARLQILELAGSSVSDADLAPIGRLLGLENLDVGRTRISDDGVRHLADIRSLYVLHLSETRITNEALRIVARNRNLSRLYLSNTAVGDIGIEYLRPLQSLTTLDLRQTRISDRSVAVLGKFPHLKELRLEETRVTQPAVDELRRQLPNCQIRH